MPKKQWTDEERKAFGEKMKAARATKEPREVPETAVSGEQDLNELKAQIKEVMETNALLKAALLGNKQEDKIELNKEGSLIGEFTKYKMDPSNYPDPTPRLAKEPRLAQIAFDYNYELTYTVASSRYQNQSGRNIQEPKFEVRLDRIVLDPQGNRVKIKNPVTGKEEEKRYKVQNIIFHEDPDTALIIARENGLNPEDMDERSFLNEMRYLRVRDWLFDIFWPGTPAPKSSLLEEVIGGQIVQVFTKSSEESSNVDFDQIKTKVR